MNANIYKSLTRRFVTLIEIMIVMFLIALIMGVVAYNYRGALDEGKAFKTRAGIEKLQTILSLAAAENPGIDLANWPAVIQNSPLVQDPQALQVDGWGQRYIVTYDQTTGAINVSSPSLNAYTSSRAASNK